MKSFTVFALISLLAAGFLTKCDNAGEERANDPLYLDANADISERVEDLLSRMTLEEKIGQMMQINIDMVNTEPGDMTVVELDPERAREAMSNYGIGSFLNGFAVPPQQWHDFVYELQTIAMEESRLDIPMIYGIDHMHGASYVEGATIFPHNINVAGTFNEELVKQMARVTVLESVDLGHHWNFAPVQDIGRQPIWPRFYETFGEDPYLASRFGAAYTRELQNPELAEPYQMAATAKHFIGYSTPNSGWDRSPADISDQHLQEFHRPPFQAVVDDDIFSVMINSGEVSGEPVHSSKRLLTGMLREQMGFEGVILTDWADIIKLSQQEQVDYQQEQFHHIAHDEKEATLMAIEAGIDMSMTPRSYDFFYYMNELVEEGKITEERIDESVRRILELKFKIGLFENPLPRDDRFERIGSEEHEEKALQAARESLVLLENQEDLLPLDPTTTNNILVVGPNADTRRDLAGGWTIEWQGAPEERYPEDMNTVYTGLQEQFPESDITLMEDIGESGSAERDEFESTAAQADFIVAVVGEESYTEYEGNIEDLRLEEDQHELIYAVQQTGTPHALVLIQGRPRILSSQAAESPAIIFAGLPGFEGGTAIAEMIAGEFNPSGKLAFSYPGETGHFTTYDHKHTDLSTAMWNFGHGLSYTEYEYSVITISASEISENEELVAEVTVSNTGNVDGKKSVLWFLQNEVGQLTRPVKQLKYFEKIELEAGESEIVSFEITADEHLWYPDRKGEQIFEAGYFTIMVGDQEERFYFNY